MLVLLIQILLEHINAISIILLAIEIYLKFQILLRQIHLGLKIDVSYKLFILIWKIRNLIIIISMISITKLIHVQFLFRDAIIWTCFFNDLSLLFLPTFSWDLDCFLDEIICSCMDLEANLGFDFFDFCWFGNGFRFGISPFTTLIFSITVCLNFLEY